MNKLMIAALLGAQVIGAAQPAKAAEIAEARSGQMGTFAGFRLRVPLNGRNAARPIQAGLALAPTLHSRSAEGEMRTRFGEGLELGLVGDRPLLLSVAGTPVSRIVHGPDGSTEHRAGVSTLGWVAIGVGALVGVVLVAGAICLSDRDCIPSE